MKKASLWLFWLAVCSQTLGSERTYAPLVDTSAPAVVSVLAEQDIASPIFNGLPPFFLPFFGQGPMIKGKTQSVGSGVLVDKKGIIITCYHVVRQAKLIKVKLTDDSEYQAVIVAVDEQNDLAALKITKNDGREFPALPLGNSDSLKTGDVVLALGNSFGIGNLVSDGIVSSKEVVVGDKRLIATNAAINPGNSGGALVNLDGALVGIPNAILSNSGAWHGVGFAIPVKLVISVINSAQHGKRVVQRAWLGVTVKVLSRAMADSLGTPAQGVIVEAVHPLSPLKGQGIEAGDVILKINGTNVNSLENFKFRLQTAALGSTLSITILSKNGKQRIIEIEAMAPPATPPPDFVTIKGNNLLHGVKLANLSPALAAQLGLDDNNVGEGGVVIVKLIPGSFAAFAGLQEGDILLAIDDAKLTSVHELEHKLLSVDRFTLTIKRGPTVAHIQFQ